MQLKGWLQAKQDYEKFRDSVWELYLAKMASAWTAWRTSMPPFWAGGWALIGASSESPVRFSGTDDHSGS